MTLEVGKNGSPYQISLSEAEGGDARSGSVSGLCVSRALATGCRVWSNEQTATG